MLPTLTSRSMDLDGLHLHWREAGDGPPVLLLHGWPTSSFLYRNVGRHLALRNRVIALDLPGFGASDKPLDASYSFRFFDRVLTGFLDAIGIAQIGLVVHDLGGPIGVHWMVGAPERVSRLAILNTLIYPRPSWAVVAFIAASYTPGLRGLLSSPWGLRKAMEWGTRGEGVVTDELVAGVQEPFAEPAARAALLKAAHGLHPKGMKTLSEGLARVTVPVRLIYGTEDRILPDVARTMSRVARELALPPEAVTALAGCGHFLQEDRPDELGALLAEFFAPPAT